MKKKTFCMAGGWMPLLYALLAALLLLAGCGTFEAGTGSEKFGLHILTPAKDFQTLGLVFTEGKQETFTYQALLKEAHKLGADAIINVVIERRTQGIGYYSASNTWYGSALAIKYTTTLAKTESVSADGKNTTSSATSVYLNEKSGNDVVNIGAPAAAAPSAAASRGSK